MDDKIKQYLSWKKVLVVEPSSTTAHSVLQVFHDLGLPDRNFFQARRLDQALALIEEVQPNIIVSEYNIDSHFGLDLVKPLANLHPHPDERIFILLTKNSEDSAVAEAAEEDVDGYLLKPFSLESLRDRCRQVIHSKLNPNPYYQKIIQGKRALQNKSYSEALLLLQAAINSSPKPSLAHFYCGKAFEGLGEWQAALAQYQLGLSFNPIHYKCLVSSFEVLDQLEKADEAYKVIQLIGKHFPVSPQRLGRMFWLAVQTKHYKDVADYYDLYTKLERRPPHLIRIVSAGLLVGGRSLLQDQRIEEAMTCFRNAVIASGRDSEMIFKVTRALMEAERGDEAEQFFLMLGPDDRTSPMGTLLEFKIGVLVREANEMVEKGRQLVLGGQADQHICDWTLQALIKQGYLTAAERLVDQIINLFPERRGHYTKVIENLPHN